MHVTLNLPDQLAQAILEQRGGQSFESRVVELLMCHPQISPDAVGLIASRDEALERILAIVKALPVGKRFKIIDLIKGWGLSAGERRQLGKEFATKMTSVGVIKLENRIGGSQLFKRV